MDDIVTRLREQNKEWLLEGDLYEKNWQLWNEAADEIERLRTDIEQRAKLMSQIVELLLPFSMLMNKHEQELLVKAVRGD
jgi:hypothetical protein